MPAYSKSTWFFSVCLVFTLWVLFFSNHDPKKTPKEYLSNVKTALTEWKPQINVRPGHNTHDRPLILYVYYESVIARVNLGFFLRHGLHGAADFIFIFNGDTDAHTIVPVERKNIKVIRRANECYDLGALAEVLTANDWKLAKKHKRFIMLNASVRGPFMPTWSSECWSDTFLNKLTDKVKLSGLTYNCHSGAGPQGHLQSSLWATDDVGLSHMLTPSGMNECFAGYQEAINSELRMTPWMRSLGFEVDALTRAFHMNDGPVRRKEHNVTMTPDGKANLTIPTNAKNMEEYYALSDWTIGFNIDPKAMDPNPQPFYVGCQGEDNNGDKTYFGIDVSPWEVLFVKLNRGINPLMYDLATNWVDGSGYSSYEHCH